MQTEPSKVCVVASGTQGEPMSALSRIAVDNHKNLSVQPGDTVALSARIIPGNEKGIYRMINHFAKRGADVIYGSMNPPVHVSGHGSVEELKLVLNLVRPRYFLPIHGEYRQLAKHASLAQHLRSVGLEDTFVLETGETLEIDKQGRAPGREGAKWAACASIRAPSTKWWRTSSSATAAISPKTASCCRLSPSTSIRAKAKRCRRSSAAGSCRSKMARICCRKRGKVVARTLESSSQEERTDWGVMQEKIRADLKRFLNKANLSAGR